MTRPGADCRRLDCCAPGSRATAFTASSQLWAETFGAELFEIDHPGAGDLPPRWWELGRHHWRELVEPHRLAFVVSTLERLVERLEAISGRALDRDALRERLELVNQQEEVFDAVRRLIAAAPECPVRMTEQITNVMATQWVRGSEWALAHARAFHDEVKQRVDDGVAACPGERARLMWIGAGLWHDTGFYTAFEASHRAVFVWSMYLAFGPDGYIRYGLDDPMAALASRTASFNEYLHNPPWAAEWIVHQAREHRIDGALVLRPRSMKPRATGRLFIERALEDAGIPVLPIEADVVDAREWDADGARAGVRSFLEKRVLSVTTTVLPAARPNWLLPFAATLIAMFALQLSNLGFSPLLPSIQQEFGMSYTQLGLFTGLYGLLAMLLSVPAGVSAKRFGEKHVLGIGLLGVAAGSVLLGEAWSFGSAIAFRGLTIFGYRFAFVSVLIAVALTAPPSLRGRTMGVLGATSALASVVGAPLGGMLVGEFGWRLAILGYAAMAVVGATVFWLFYRPTSDDPRGAGAHDDARRRQPERLSLARRVDDRADRRARRLRAVHRDLLRPERGEGVVRPRRDGGGSHHQHRLPHCDRGESRRWPADRPLQQARRARSRVHHSVRRIRVVGHREPLIFPGRDGHGDRLRLYGGESVVRPRRLGDAPSRGGSCDGRRQPWRRPVRILRSSDARHPARPDRIVCGGLLHGGRSPTSSR